MLLARSLFDLASQVRWHKLTEILEDFLFLYTLVLFFLLFTEKTLKFQIFSLLLVEHRKEK